MHTVTWGRTRANLRALKQKMGSPLGGAIFDGNHQYWYQINQWIILHALVGVAKQYRKYFRFRAKNHFSIFHPYLKSHLRSKIVRISWKFGQLCKMSQIIIIYEKNFREYSINQNINQSTRIFREIQSQIIKRKKTVLRRWKIF